MRIHIIAVGKIKERGIREGIDDYIGRLRRYARVEERELRDGSDADVAARFEKALPAGARVVALEVGGKALSSEGFAEVLERWDNGAIQEVAFLIGGAEGLPRSVTAKADMELSLSTMTLPHRLARLLLCEQIYRAYTIRRGEPYSK
ncbi:MAG: 23S rRNA (pseudouridine(1915)-N(3))-methyltransferase RlmH [Myxococcales bacterium]|nr:23S rRNA (pseudouridine(1915)-N(3))-methyltransferase RlmH [Myxococcales bacterium]